MTTCTETKYKVQSLERGLTILRELRMANAPVRNQDLVKRTRLPKATVSRLLYTLGALGYVRRIDQGSYVLAQASGRSGRALISGLGLERYQALFAGAPGPVYLETAVGGVLAPVFRWSASSAVPLPHGCVLALGPNDRADHGKHWNAEAGTWCVWAAMPLDGVGKFALTLHVHAASAPTREQLDAGGGMLAHAVNTITSGRTS